METFEDGKTTAQYRNFFQIVNSKIGEFWDAAQIISDFERAITADVETEFPHKSHQGCYFHLTRKLSANQKHEAQCSVKT